MAGDDEQNAVFIVACPGRAENSSVGSTIHICYSHNEPSKDPLMTGPQALLPLDRSLGATWRHCSKVSYTKAKKCKKSLAGVKWTMLGLFLIIPAFVVLVISVHILMLFVSLWEACLRFLRRNRAVIPDRSLEMAGEEA